VLKATGTSTPNLFWDRSLSNLSNSKRSSGHLKVGGGERQDLTGLENEVEVAACISMLVV
jgi:hypothetical protein